MKVKTFLNRQFAARSLLCRSRVHRPSVKERAAPQAISYSVRPTAVASGYSEASSAGTGSARSSFSTTSAERKASPRSTSTFPLRPGVGSQQRRCRAAAEPGMGLQVEDASRH